MSSQRAFEPGDRVRINSDIDDEVMVGQPPVEVTRAGDVGVVIPGTSNGWLTVWCERTQRVTICDPEELVLVGAAVAKTATKSANEVRHVRE